MRARKSNFRLPVLLAGALAAGAVLAAEPPTIVKSAEPPAARLDEVLRDLEQSRQRQRDLDDEIERLGNTAKSLRVRIVAAAVRLQEQEEILTRGEARLATVLAEEGAKVADLNRRHAELGVTLGGLAKLVRLPPEAMLAAPGTALDLGRASGLVAQAVPAIERKADALRAQLAALAETRRQVSVERATVQKSKGKLDEERRQLIALQGETAVARRQSIAASRDEAKRATALAQSAKDLQALLAGLTAEAETAESAPPAVSPSGPTPVPPPSRGETQARLAPPSTAKSAALVGALPARGRLIGRFGDQSENGTALKGIRIETRTAAQVVAPADGKIVFAGPFRGYGLLLIIAHGEGYHSLLAGMARLDSAVGQTLVAGEPVGLMGDGDGGKPKLYVELRLRGEPINPLPWLASGERKVSG